MSMVREFTEKEVVGSTHLNTVFQNSMRAGRSSVHVLVKAPFSKYGELVSVLGFRGTVEAEVPQGILVKVQLPSRLKKSKER